MITPYSIPSISASHQEKQTSSGPATWPLVVASTGTGAVLARMVIYASASTSATLDGSARFYTDGAGTLNESSVWELSAGLNTRYIKVPSGTSNLVFADKSLIYQWGKRGTAYDDNGWRSRTNGPSVTFDFAALPALTVLCLHTLTSYLFTSGDFSALNGTLEYLFIYQADNANVSGVLEAPSIQFFSTQTSNTSVTSIDVTGKAGLYYLNVWRHGTVSGSVDGCTSLARVGGNDYLFSPSGDLSILAPTLYYLDTPSGGSSTLTYPATGVSGWGTTTPMSRFKLTSQAWTPAVGDALINDLGAAATAGRWVASGGTVLLRISGGRTAASDTGAAALAAANVSLSVAAS